MQRQSDYIIHYGVGHDKGGHSGRYPWGSGKNKLQKKDGSLTRAGRRKELKYNKPQIVAAKKALEIVEEDYNQKNALKEEATRKTRDFYINKMYKTDPENQHKLKGEEKKLLDEYNAIEEKYLEAFRNRDYVKSYIKGLEGQPLKQYDFEYGEEGRQYVNKLLRQPEYRDLFWDEKTKKLKKK